MDLYTLPTVYPKLWRLRTNYNMKFSKPADIGMLQKFSF